jgi:hypothetical protein
LNTGIQAAWVRLPQVAAVARWFDLSGYGRHATVSGSPPVSPPVWRYDGRTELTGLKVGNLYPASASGLPTTFGYGFTTAALVRPDSVSSRSDFFGRWEAGSYQSLLTVGITGNKYSFYFDGGSFPNATGTTDATTTRTDLVVGTHDGTAGRIYVNGVLEASTTAAFGTGTANWRIGESGDDAGDVTIFGGWVWSRTLSAGEIGAFYDQYRRGFPDVFRRVRSTRSWHLLRDTSGDGGAATAVPVFVHHMRMQGAA